MNNTRVILQATNPKWDHAIAAARALDTVNDSVREEPAARRAMFWEGYRVVEIAPTVNGTWMARDTFSRAILLPGPTKAACVAWASQWHSEDMANREVLMADDSVPVLA